MNTKKLAEKVAVVTGASKGIGADIAKHLAAEGAAVVVNYASSKEGADRVVDEITKGGGKAIAVQADVAKKKDIERLFAETKKTFGQLDILVNNAGVYKFEPLEVVTENEFHRQFNTNVLGLILATQEAVKHFGTRGGSVINIGGHWRWIYVVTAVIALYFNVFVAVVQAFEKVPALKVMAPTQTEPPFKLTQLVVLALFVALGIVAAIRFRNEPIRTT